MNVNKFLVVMVMMLTLNVSLARAQEILTDRPGQSTSPTVIPAATFQIESGFIFEEDHTDGLGKINYTYNTSLLRFGVNNNFEARICLGYLGTQPLTDDAPIITGLGPVALGVKIKVADEKGIWPSTAVISNINVKVGTNGFNPRYTAADIAFAFSHTLSKKFSLTYNAGIKWDGENPRPIWSYTCSLAFAVTPNLGVFTEVYGFYPDKHVSDNRIDGGITYRIVPRIQFDLSSGVGLTRHSPDYFVSAGLSARLFK